jgi:thioester reductase-like protein
MPADISKPHLGLSRVEYADLVADVGRIFHAAAVNHVISFPRLAATNVEGTRGVIRLAAEHGADLHHLSCSSVARSRHHSEGTVPERHRITAEEVLLVPYLATKWVAEELVFAASARGLPSWIHRLGRVSGHSITGVCRRDDPFWSFVTGATRLGAVPSTAASIDLTPVDYAVRAMLHLAGTPPGVFGLTNPYLTPISRVFDHLRDHGYPILDVPHEQWSTRWGPWSRDPVRARAVLRAGDWDRTPSLDNTATLQLLSAAGITCPHIGMELLDRVLAYFRSIETLAEPEHVIPGQMAQSRVPDHPAGI